MSVILRRLVLSDLFRYEKQKKGWKDCHNYLVTSDNINGPWSNPIYLNSSGFDPSLFHDDNGVKWLVNMKWSYQKGKDSFAGILLQEYSEEQKKLVGKVYNILENEQFETQSIEGPHIYKRDGYYYLMVAEGGTSYNHSAQIFRSKNITGPYETHPDNPILTAREDPDLSLQKSGHGDFVETQNGEWYMVHLCGRPVGETKRCPLGRETAIQKVVWKNEWPYLENGTNKPETYVQKPDLPEFSARKNPLRDDFDEEKLNTAFQTLRIPFDDEIGSLKMRKGYLRLFGRESLCSDFTQALVARRWQHFSFDAMTCVEFSPENELQMAGLVCLYDTEHFYYLNVSKLIGIGVCFNVISCDNLNFEQVVSESVCEEQAGRYFMKVCVRNEKIQFYYSFDETNWIKIGENLDALKLSDEHCNGFTGAYVGICAQDLMGTKKYADFDYFEYKPQI